jgi:hypothetical protein
MKKYNSGTSTPLLKTILIITRFSSIALTLLLLPSCLSMTSFQSGKSLGKKRVAMQMGASFNNVYDDAYSMKDYDNIPGMQFGIRAGVSERFDLGMRLDGLSLISINSKVQLLGNQESIFAASVGFDAGMDLGMMLIAIGHTMISVPLYLSVHPSEKFAVYATPRFSKVWGFSMLENSNNRRLPLSNEFNAYTLGIMYGKKNYFAVEATYLDMNSHHRYIYSLGYTFVFGH